MKMKRLLFASTLASACACAAPGCGSKRFASVETAETPAVPRFSAKNGLLLPEQTRKSLGLKMVEVTERKLTSRQTFDLRVYRTEGTTALASGTVTPEQAKGLKPGKAVEVDLLDGKTQTGRLTSVNDDLKISTGSVEVVAEIPNASDALPVGAFVQANVTMESGNDVVTIPRSALLRCSEGLFVYTVSGEHLVRTAVKIGASNAEFVQITDGLYAGDEVVLQPVMLLWMTELAAVKGGQSCCIEPPKGK